MSVSGMLGAGSGVGTVLASHGGRCLRPPGGPVGDQVGRGVEAPGAAPEVEGPAGPERGVATGVVQIPALTSPGRPDRALHFPLELLVEPVLDLGPDLDSRDAAPPHRPERV